ncbi:MAG: NADH-quinone oxidoreductase subunit A [Bacteroidota bacterium]|nr:NADH-quinone oxidoreductase subunit A [Ignavibacteriales bacterium]
MNNAANTLSAWPLLIYAVAAVALVGIMIGLSYVLGQRHEEPQTDTPFESGIKVTGSARLRFSVQFYLVAMFFVVFDLESVFIVAWAIAFHDAGWVGYLGVLAFILILAIVLIYEWRIGALDFGPNNKRILKAYRKNYRKSTNI